MSVHKSNILPQNEHWRTEAWLITLL